MKKWKIEELDFGISTSPVSIERSPESTAGDVEIVGEILVLGLLGSQQYVSIERPSPEALSISPLEAEEEILEEVEDRRTGFWDFHDSRLDCQTACQDRCLNKLGP